MTVDQQKYLMRLYRNGCTTIHHNHTNIFHLRRKANPYMSLIHHQVYIKSEMIKHLTDNGYCYYTPANNTIYLTKKGIEYAKIFIALNQL